MPTLSISLPHALDRAEAKKRSQECIVQFRAQFGGSIAQIDDRWNGDTMDFTFVALGMPVTGQVHVEDRAVRLEINLPWMLSKLAGGIKRSIEQQSRKLRNAP